jgi:hypothetical protein
MKYPFQADECEPNNERDCSKSGKENEQEQGPDKRVDDDLTATHERSCSIRKRQKTLQPASIRQRYQ